jgi:small subunit ribosomal protein S8
MMPTTDPIADYLTRVRNAMRARHMKVDVPYSKLKKSLSQVLLDGGYIRDYVNVDDGRQGFLRLYLKYGAGGKSAIAGLKRVSTPGLRRYVGKDEIPRVLNGLGVTILSTPRGIMTGGRARKLGVGGEVLAYIW